MKKVFDVGIGLMIIILVLAALGFIISAFRFENGAYFAIGLGCITSTLTLIGFFYIVEAACLYIEKRNQEIYQEQIEQEESDSQEE